jgi:hypothetical protein
MPKCQVCNEVSRRSELIVVDIRESSKVRKDGTPGLIRKYVHPDCHPLYLEQKKFKEIEAKKLDDLYRYLMDLHKFVNVDDRMFVFLQDLRNGTIILKGFRFKKYKEGVPFELMLQTYKYLSKTIDNILRTMTFKDKWQEFLYVFVVMERCINEVNEMNKRQQKHEKKMNAPVNAETIEINVPVKKKKGKDELDITDFL